MFEFVHFLRDEEGGLTQVPYSLKSSLTVFLHVVVVAVCRLCQEDSLENCLTEEDDSWAPVLQHIPEVGLHY